MKICHVNVNTVIYTKIVLNVRNREIINAQNATSINFGFKNQIKVIVFVSLIIFNSIMDVFYVRLLDASNVNNKISARHASNKKNSVLSQYKMYANASLTLYLMLINAIFAVKKLLDVKIAKN
jgi:hypothetical protein